MIQIDKVILHHMKMKLKYPFTTSFGTVTDKEFYIIEMVDQDGVRGYGETVPFQMPWYTEETFNTSRHILNDVLIPMLENMEIHHPSDLAHKFKSIKRHHMAKTGLEAALWDLYAKKLQKPLWQAIGGNRERIVVGVSLGIERDTEILLNKIDGYVKDGYQRIKIKIKPGKDIFVVKKVRERFPDIPLMVDANSSYTLKDAAHLKQLDAFNLMMIEQPLADNDIIDHACLQKEITTPICLDESIHSYEDARMAITLGSCEIINIKVGRVGGLTEAIRIHDLCVQNQVAVWCGGMLEAGVGRAHNIALASLSGFSLPGDISASSRYFGEDIIHPEVTVTNGEILVNNKAGIGFDIHSELLKKYTVERIIKQINK